jgi:hypothetical protein
VDYSEFMKILNTTDDLLEKFACFYFLQTLFLDDVVKKFAPTSVLSNQEQLFRCLNDFKQLDDVGVPNALQNINLPGYSLNISLLNNLLLF